MDVQLLLALVLGIATIVVLVLWTRLDAFVALLIAALVTGLLAGLPIGETIASITTGFGNTLGSIGIVIGLGVAIGKMLEVSGAAERLARAFVKALGRGREHWAMAGTGAVVSIPVFCDSGYVIMNPLARSIARRIRGRYVVLALALGCGMTLTHHLVPPTPGPLAVAGILGAQIGALILAGLVFTLLLIPVVIGYAAWMGPKLESEVNEQVREAVYAGVAETTSGATGSASAARTITSNRQGSGDIPRPIEEGEPPADEPLAHQLGETPEGGKPHKVGLLVASLPLFVPLLLIVLNTVTTAIDRNALGALDPDQEYTPTGFAGVMAFIGNPVIALLVGIILAVYLLLPRWTPRRRVHHWLAEAAASAGLIILITGAGGALGQVLRDSGVGDELAEAIAQLALPSVLVPFLVASLVRLAQGSGTVAMITAASVSAPLVIELGLSPLLAALACCAGSMVFSYFNDSYFWVVTRFTGLDGTAALQGWSGITTAVWAASLPLLLIASLFL
ncbi:GntP family permease [Geodermatophilus sp. DF01-2]|uniref:GntP family permease n=1 Tax=Geodermatophilus sp. DF01-2 TaxID=2559610 RepID=UPI00107432B5|nr:GntP family permease [Geodermatophilus sp. DF01_2]TFV58348.1 GntP family permease [Geodermatophilus sp. DF01_2]